MSDYMSVSYRPSSLIRGYPPGEIRYTEETYDDVREHKLIQGVDTKIFLQTYLSGPSINPTAWSSKEQELLDEIQSTPRSMEKTLYTGNAPLLRLLNFISERISEFTHHEEPGAVNSIEPTAAHGTRREFLVFYTAENCEVHNPFYRQHRKPDIIALWERSEVFPEVDYSRDRFAQTTWCALAAVGEVKVVKSKRRSKDGRFQLGNYLQNHLQLHPELNAVLGLTARPSGYGLFYHDATAIHRAGFPWNQPSPLYAFIQKLYDLPFRDTSMQIINGQSQPPVWAMKIGKEVYISEEPRALAGSGQRQFTTTAINVETLARVFIKDIWRDVDRTFSRHYCWNKPTEENLYPG